MGVDFRQAALRSFAHAKVLHGDERRGTSDHLYGLAAECALKALLQDEGAFELDQKGRPPPEFKKHVNELRQAWNDYVAKQAGLGSKLIVREDFFKGWKVDHRYYGDADFDRERLERHATDATAVMQALEHRVTDGALGGR